MPAELDVRVPLTGLEVLGPDGPLDLGAARGVHVLVLMRHRH
ncbi:MAG TPA: hypothetical protein VF661_16230 [Actinomycetales bacterium]